MVITGFLSLKMQAISGLGMLSIITGRKISLYGTMTLLFGMVVGSALSIRLAFILIGLVGL